MAFDAYHSQGEGNGRTTLTENDVREIRRMYDSGNYKQKQIAEIYGIHQTAVSKIILHLTWRHIEQPTKPASQPRPAVREPQAAVRQPQNLRPLITRPM